MGTGNSDWSATGRRPVSKPNPPKSKRQIDREAEWERKLRYIENYKWKPPKATKAEEEANAAAEKDRQKRLKELQDRLNLQVQIYLTQWKNEIDAGIDQAPFPDRSESRFGFYLALAGNLLWAATAFINPAAAIAPRIIQAMSVTGATVGSGTVTTLFPNRPVDELNEKDGKELVREVAGIQATELQEVFREAVPQWAEELEAPLTEFTGSAADRLLMFEKRVWERVFPVIAYDEDRLNVIRKKCKDKVTKLMVEYKAQWDKFKTDSMKPGPTHAALWAYGTLAMRPTKFVPDLSIDFAE